MKLEARIDAVVGRLRDRGVDVLPLDDAPWILEIENQIGHQLPETYRALVLRYTFPSFELGPVVFFSNRGDRSYDDITTAPFKDPILSSWVIRSGYFHFSQTSSDDYDPVCIALTSPSFPNKAIPVVKFDHEAILLERAPVPSEIVADSLLQLLEDCA